MSTVGRTTYSYDAAERLTTIAASFGGSAGPVVALGYDNANRLTSLSRTIGGTGTAITSAFGYDNANRLTTLTHQVGGGSGLASYAYAYDNANRLTHEVNAEGGITYAYDNTDQLTGTSGSSAATYTYDANGNRTMSGYATGGNNQMTSGAGYTYTYDNEGNLTGKTETATGYAWSYTWDYRNRLTGVVEETSGHSLLMRGTYTYDAMNRRVIVDETVGGVSTKVVSVYDGMNVYADYNGSGTLLVRYTDGPAISQVLARTTGSGTTSWYLTDNHGTVRDVVGTTGTILDHVAYDVYGGVASETNASNGDRFKYDGMQYDQAIRLYSDNARYYDPATGRFMTVDPTGFMAGDPNLYRFVKNGPTIGTDPTGLVDDPIISPRQWGEWNEMGLSDAEIQELLDHGAGPEQITNEAWRRVARDNNTTIVRPTPSPTTPMQLAKPPMDVLLDGLTAAIDYADPVIRPAMAVGQFIGGGFQAFEGSLMMAAPEPFATKVAGAAFIAMGSDNMLAAARTLVSGESKPTILNSGLEAIGTAGGMTEQEAKLFAFSGEILASALTASQIGGSKGVKSPGVAAPTGTVNALDIASERALLAATADDLASFLGKSQSNAKRGPVLSVLRDRVTGEIFDAQNLSSIPDKLHPLIESRLDSYLSAYGKNLNPVWAIPGTHSEVAALNQALLRREMLGMGVQSLDDFSLYNVSLWKNRLGTPIPRCGNCQVLTDGVRVLSGD